MYHIIEENGIVLFSTPFEPEGGTLFVTDITEASVSVNVPEKATNLKFRLALIQVGILPSNIDLAIESMPSGSEKELIFTLWNYADYFERNDEKLILMANSMFIESEQLDGLFILADKL